MSRSLALILLTLSQSYLISAYTYTINAKANLVVDMDPAPGPDVTDGFLQITAIEHGGYVGNCLPRVFGVARVVTTTGVEYPDISTKTAN